MRRRRKLALVLLASFALALVAGELALRWALFSGGARFARLRQPGRFADWFRDDDFWKLQVLLGGKYGPPEHPHPELGWVGPFDRKTYLHDDAAAVRERRAVLLYGDSFAQCVPAAECFQDLLNHDPEFAAEHHLLNYGVGGYGTDQILLLLRGSVDLYDDPFVVLSLMTLDLDRAVLSVRTGQKPRFHLAGGALEREPTPILADPARFYAENPPKIRSYLYRGLLFSRLVPLRVHDALRDEDAMIARKQVLNERILVAALDELRRRDLDFLVVVFHPHVRGNSTLDGPPDWRELFLRDLFEREGVPYVWSEDLIRSAAGWTPGAPFDPAPWILAGDLHPTTAYNALVAEEIRAAVLAR